jgi:hypothetical protein
MQLRRNILELFEAIPDRIEVSGHEPTWQVTGGSFDDVVSFANDAFDRPAVISRQDRSRWWPRVTLTVTTDPDLAAGAPPLEALADPEPLSEPEPGVDEPPSAQAQAQDQGDDAVDDPAEDTDDEAVLAFLEGAFARQEQEHQRRGRRFPRQRDGRHR